MSKPQPRPPPPPPRTRAPRLPEGSLGLILGAPTNAHPQNKLQLLSLVKLSVLNLSISPAERTQQVGGTLHAHLHRGRHTPPLGVLRRRKPCQHSDFSLLRAKSTFLYTLLSTLPTPDLRVIPHRASHLQFMEDTSWDPECVQTPRSEGLRSTGLLPTSNTNLQSQTFTCTSDHPKPRGSHKPRSDSVTREHGV